MKTTHFQFNSIEELIKTTEQEAPTSKGNKSAFNSWNDPNGGRSSFCGGVKNAKEYNDLINNGWRPAADTLRLTEAGENKTVFFPSVSGEFNDPGAFLAGLPECMLEVITETAPRLKNIYIEAATPGFTDADTIMKKTRAIFNAVETCEQAGTRCQIFIKVGVITNGKKMILTVKAKDHSEPLIPIYHGLILGHLATVRGVMYAYLSLYSKSSSIGAPAEDEPQPDGVTVSYQTDSPETIKNKIINQ
jgi:hypothetical protein